MAQQIYRDDVTYNVRSDRRRTELGKVQYWRIRIYFEGILDKRSKYRRRQMSEIVSI